ncbi:MAG: hypothetical protein NDJ89_14720 [Oligoflexia bacterium]|nr:hypothetical protein [Oligoflexia bacterium]
MKRLRLSRGYRKVAVCMLGAAWLAGCRGSVATEETASPVPSAAPSETPIQEGVVNDTVGFQISIPDATTHDYAIHEASSWSTPCKITASSASKSIDCYVEGHELDLYFFGAKLNYNVPKDLCSYVRVSPPYFYFREPGDGPTAISYDVDQNGAFQNVSPAGILVGGQPSCAYDYTSEDGPNCCSGKYSLSVRVWDATAGAYGSPTVSEGDWGGKVTQCLAGPAMSTQSLSKYGWPRPSVHFVEGTGVNRTYEVTAPMSKDLASNLHVANYFVASEHGNDVPLAFRTPANASDGAATEPYYRFTCYDRAQEVNAEIRVMIRDWNSKSELAKEASGDPDASGSEGGSFPTHPIGDRRDWKDIGLAYPAGSL